MKRKLVIQKKKNPDISGLVRKLDYSTKSSEIESKISSISGLATSSTLTVAEKKILDVSKLVINRL